MAGWIAFDDDYLAKDLEDPETRAVWDRLELAHELAIWLMGYRQKHKLSQTALGHRLGWHQQAVARMEIGEHDPDITTLRRIAERLGLTIAITVRPTHVDLRLSPPLPSAHRRTDSRTLAKTHPRLKTAIDSAVAS